MHTAAGHSYGGIIVKVGCDANEKSFGSAYFWVEMGENIISLISEHLILCDKHHNNYLDNQVEDNMWLEIREDEDVESHLLHFDNFCVFFGRGFLHTPAAD